MITYQDFEKARDKLQFCANAIDRHKMTVDYSVAVSADYYDHQLNETILNYTKTLYTLTGSPVVDFTASNNKICSNFFHRLNTQRNTYLLGNGVSYDKPATAKVLGDSFDTDLKMLAYKSLIHGVSFGYWANKLYCFPVTEFVPFWDEDTGALMAGVRFWRVQADDLDNNQYKTDAPTYFVLYEVGGWTKAKIQGGKLTEVVPKSPYRTKVISTPALGEEIIGGDNYSSLPVIPVYGSSLKQSTLVGLRRSIDSYDLIRSGFANDLSDCAQIYWIVENAGGMSDGELDKFRDKLKFLHIADIDTDSGAGAHPVTQEIPYAARTAYLERIRNGIYEDFGAFDVSSVSAAAKTATEINAAYQPMDEEADDYEYQLIQFIQQLFELLGISDTPHFKRNRIANQLEQTQMVLQAASYLDEETVLSKLPFLAPDEVGGILKRRDEETVSKFSGPQPATNADMDLENADGEDAEEEV